MYNFEQFILFVVIQFQVDCVCDLKSHWKTAIEEDPNKPALPAAGIPSRSTPTSRGGSIFDDINQWDPGSCKSGSPEASLTSSYRGMVDGRGSTTGNTIPFPTVSQTIHEDALVSMATSHTSMG